MARPVDLQTSLVASLNATHDALTAANQLCLACVTTLAIDGAAISVMYDGTSRGTFGSSSETSRELDELQFTYGEGPCLEAVSTGVPVLVADLDDPQESRWPAFRESVRGKGVVAVFALPIALASSPIGALDLYRHEGGPLSAETLDGALFAAKLAKLPLLALLAEVDWDSAADGGSEWEQLASLERVEVYQATGMLMAALEIDAVEALVRIRSYAFGHSMTASAVAYAIVDGRLPVVADYWRGSDGG